LKNLASGYPACSVAKKVSQRYIHFSYYFALL
jgi:hypothetical protein